MGKDSYWAGGRGGKPTISSSRKAYADERKDKITSSSTRSNNSHRIGTTIASGCMNALFHFLDFRFPLQRQQRPSSSFKPSIDFLPQDPKGLVAPRNSLESMDHDLLSMASKEKTKITPMGIQIKTNAGFTRSKLGSLTMDSPCSSSDMSNSPTIKTPSLVARLMGLDILPDNDLQHSQPSLQRPKPNKTGHRSSVDCKNTGTRSLPGSPRTSSARRSDFDYHRLSLQLNKENNKSEVQSRSPRDYAREIVNKVKERVSSRRFGLEMTNTANNREQKSLRNHLDEIRKDSTLLCSSRRRTLESKTKLRINDKTVSPSMSKIGQNFQPPNPSAKLAIVSEPRAIIVSAKPRLQLLREENPQRKQQKELRSIKGCKKAEGQSRFGPSPMKPSQTSDIVRNKQEEIFVRPSTRSKTNKENSTDKKFSKTPISNDLIKISAMSAMPIKRIPPNSATKARQKQVPEALEPANNSRSQSMHRSNIIGEREYVIEILRHLSINGEDIPVCSVSWRSLPRPLHPSIFENLEHLEVNTRRPSDQLNLRCNRKLLFDLVDEIFDHVLEPQKIIGVISHAKRRRDFSGSQLIDALCQRISSYPSANCRVLEDIDELVAGDFPAEETAVEDETERIAAGIERDIFYALVAETASFYRVGLQKRNDSV